VPLLKAMFSAATEAWDRAHLEQVVSARTVSIPTHGVKTTNFNLTAAEANGLYEWGDAAASAFFKDEPQQTYLNSFVAVPKPAVAVERETVAATA
jgi:NTE family protein